MVMRGNRMRKEFKANYSFKIHLEHTSNHHTTRLIINMEVAYGSEIYKQIHVHRIHHMKMEPLVKHYLGHVGSLLTIQLCVFQAF